MLLWVISACSDSSYTLQRKIDRNVGDYLVLLVHTHNRASPPNLTHISCLLCSQDLQWRTANWPWNGKLVESWGTAKPVVKLTSNLIKMMSVYTHGQNHRLTIHIVQRMRVRRVTEGRLRLVGRCGPLASIALRSCPKLRGLSCSNVAVFNLKVFYMDDLIFWQPLLVRT
jgi:hypothetical protein